MFWISSLWIVDVGWYLLNVFKWTYYSNGLQELTCLWISVFIGTKMVWISREICIAGWIVQAENCKFIIWFLLLCEAYKFFICVLKWLEKFVKSVNFIILIFYFVNDISLVENWFLGWIMISSLAARALYLKSCGLCILVIWVDFVGLGFNSLTGYKVQLQTMILVSCCSFLVFSKLRYR